MVHGRMIRPPVAGAVPVKVDEARSRTFRAPRWCGEKGFLGVVADKEWDAIQAAREAQGRMVGRRSRRSRTRPRSTTTSARRRCASATVETAKRQCRRRPSRPARKVIEAEYEWPFQSHASMGPACALVEIKDGNVTCWTGSQKSHFVQRRHRHHCSACRSTRCTSIWTIGPGSYGRNDADDCRDGRGGAGAGGRQAGAAAIYARPGHRLGSEGPGLDPQGARRRSTPPARSSPTSSPARAFSRVDVDTNGGKPPDTLAGQTAGRGAEIRRRLRRAGGILRLRQQAAGLGDDPAAARPRARRCAPRICAIRSGRRSTSPASPSSTRWRRRVNADPVEFRLRHIKEPRDIAVIKAAAREGRIGQTRPSPRRDQTGNKVSGRGIAYAQRNGTRVAVIAEVDVDRSTGKIWARKFTVAHDCGQIINPDGLVKCIEGNIVQGVSRTLWEEVTFDRKAVTSVDWVTYPILDITETPGAGRRGADQPSGDRAVRRRRAVDPPGRRGDRQRHLRCHRRAHPPRAVLARTGEGGAVVIGRSGSRRFISLDAPSTFVGGANLR